MQIVPTKDPHAKREGENINVELQDDLTISLSLDQAIDLYHGVQHEVRELLNEVSEREPESAQIIAFPVHATRRAMV